MPDNLTLKFQRELEKRSKSQTTATQLPSTAAGGPVGSMWDNLGRDQYDPGQGVGDLGLLEPVKLFGAGLWQFADTWTFGAAGLLDDKLFGGVLEDTLYDEESAWAKWGGAVGGLMGFMGNPMKLGFKAAGALARPAMRVTGQSARFMPDVARSMTQKGIAAGLSKKQAKQVVGHYDTLVAKSRMHPDIANKWKKHSEILLDDMLKKGLGQGKLSQVEAAAVKEMFKGNMGRRPVKDLVDVVMRTGKFKKPETAFVVGSMLNEAVAFGLIDAVFETTRSIKDGDAYGWTAPIWGMFVGAGFGMLKMLPAAGKASETFDWKKGDFIQGLKVLYGGDKSRFTKFTGPNLESIAEGHAQMLKDYGEKAFIRKAPFMKTLKKPWIVQVPYKGSIKGKESMRIDLSKAPQYKTFDHVGEEAAESMVRDALSKSTRNLGKELIEGSIRDEALSMAANWHRMIGGAIVMNARTFWGMFKGQEMDVHDVLPHVLIGAWVNRRGNPAGWDMKTQRMENIRGNLRFLGFDVPNLQQIPDFNANAISSYINPMYTSANLKPVTQEMKDREIITDNTDAVFASRTNKSKGEKSIQMEDTPTARIFKVVYTYSDQLMKHQRPLDDIPIADAKSVVAIFKKQAKLKGWEIKSEKDALDYFDMQAESSTENLKSEWIRVMEETSSITQKFTVKQDPKMNETRLPEFAIHENLYEQMERLSPNESVDAIESQSNTLSKINTIFEHLRESHVVDPQKAYSERVQVRIETAEELVKLKELVDGLEQKLSTSLPADQKFDILESSEPVHRMMMYNYYRSSIETISNIFDATNNEVHPLLKDKLANIAFPSVLDPVKQTMIPSVSPRYLEITDAPKSDPDAHNARRILGGVIEMLGAHGQYPLAKKKDLKPGDKDWEPYTSVPYSKIENVINFLKNQGIVTREGSMTAFQSEIVHYIGRKRIEGSSLTSSDVSSLNNAAYLGWANFNYKPGEASGWSISKLDAIRHDKESPIGKTVLEINTRIDELVNNSTTFDKNGKKIGQLVKVEKNRDGSDKTVVINEAEINALRIAYKETGHIYDAKMMLNGMLNILDPKFGSFREQSHSFVGSMGGTNAMKLLGWLQNLGIVEVSKKGTLEQTEKAMEMLQNTNVMKKLSQRMELEGAKTLREIDEKRSHIQSSIDSAMKGFEDNSNVSQMTAARFFTKYKIKDAPGADYEAQVKYLNNLLFDANNNVVAGGIKRMVDNIIVKKNGKDVLIGSLEGSSYENIFRDHIPDVINLLRVRSESKELPWLRYEDGSLKEDVTKILRNPDYDMMFEAGFSPMLISSEVSMLMPSFSGTMRKSLSVFEYAAEGISDGVRGTLEKSYKRLLERLDRTVELKEGTESPMATDGLILFRLGPDHTPFVLPKNQMDNLVNEYVKFMGELDKAISLKKITIPDAKYTRLHQLKDALLGGELKTGDKVYWKDASDRLSLSNHEFTVQGVNPDNPSKIKLAVDREVDLSEKVDKTHQQALRKAITEGVSRENLEPVNGDRKPSNEEYIAAMKRWNSYKWLVGETGDWSVLQKYFESPDNNKLLSRYRLYQTKNFGREQRHLFDGVPLTERQKKLMSKYKTHTNIAIYDDVANHDVKDMMKKQLEQYGLSWEGILGDRKSDSGIDSIAYVSKDQMEYLSFTHGFKNWENMTVLKPVISSNKETILFAKTLFIYDPAMDSFFDRHSKEGKPIDILLTGSASKIVGSDWNVVSKKLSPTSQLIAKGDIKKLPLDAIGVKSEDYQELDLAKRSLSNFNYMKASEGKEIYTRDYDRPLDQAMKSISKVLTDHTHINAFLKKSFPNEDTIESMMGNESNATANIGFLRYYNDISDFSNAMDISPRMVYNRLYKHFIDPVINGKSIMWGETGYMSKSEGRFGGKAVMIQSLDPKWQNMKGTIVGNDGTIHQIGEIGLPHADREVRLDALSRHGYEMRFVNEETSQIIEAKDVFGEKFWKEALSNGWRLGDVHDFLKETSRVHKEKVRPDYIVSHRKGDHKLVFIEGSESYDRAISEGIIKLSKRGVPIVDKGRARNTEYKKRDKITGKKKKMYDVFVNMVEHQKMMNPADNKPMDIWIARDEAEARRQFENIKANDGTNFVGMNGIDRTSGAFGVAIMSNRYPRTRPNDVTYLRLKDFLDKRAGNVVILNPFDVLNVFEGDYDADRSDYYFMQSKAMADHVVNTIGKNWVQGIEPEAPDLYSTKLTASELDPYDEHVMYEKGIANSLIHSKARGVSQTMSRLLNHMSHISLKVTDKMLQGNAKLRAMDKSFGLLGKNIIMQRGPRDVLEAIVMDYDNNNVHHRLTLNAQTMLDASVAETNLFDNVSNWKRELFFGSPVESFEKMTTFDKIKPGFDVGEISRKEIGRPRIFRKFKVEGEDVREERLNVVEQEILMEMMSNHSKFLQIIPGVFEKSGERKSPSYEEVWQISDDYFSFFQNVGDNLYYKLKNNRAIKKDQAGMSILNSMFHTVLVPKNKERWKYVDIGADVEGKPQWQLTDAAIKKKAKFNKDDFFWKSKYNPWKDKTEYQSLFDSIHQGKSGHVIDMIFNKIWQNNIFADRVVDRKLTGTDRAELDDLLRRYMHSNLETLAERKQAFGEYVDGVKYTVTDINKKKLQIPKLKRHWAKVDRMKITEEFTEEKKTALKDGINESIREVENEIGSFLSTPYWKNKAGKDVGEPIKYRDLHRDQDLREGAIQYYTLRALADLDWNASYGAKNAEMNEHLQTLHKLESIFYSDWAGGKAEKTTFTYGPWMTLLGEKSRKYLEEFPDRATFEEVRDELLNQGEERFGRGYIYRYAQPVLDKMTIGVFHDVPVPVPFRSSNKYKVMLKFLARRASEHDGGGTNHAKLTLRRLSDLSDRWRNLLEDRTDMIPGQHKMWQEFSEFIGMGKKTLYHDIGWQNLQMPDLHRDFVRQYKKYNSIRFDINRRDRTDPIMLTNNHVLNFYRDLFKATELSKDFETYLDKMSAITALEIEGRYIDPMMYLATLQKIEGDILPKLNRVLEDGNLRLLENSIEAQRLRNNPLWSILGGSKFVLGKKMSFNPIKRLSKYELEVIETFIKQGRDIKEKTGEATKIDEVRDSWLKCPPTIGDINE